MVLNRLLKEPASANRDDVVVTGELKAQPCRELPVEVIVTGEFEVSVTVTGRRVIHRSANLELRRNQATCAA